MSERDEVAGVGVGGRRGEGAIAWALLSSDEISRKTRHHARSDHGAPIRSQSRASRLSDIFPEVFPRRRRLFNFLATVWTHRLPSGPCVAAPVYQRKIRFVSSLQVLATASRLSTNVHFARIVVMIVTQKRDESSSPVIDLALLVPKLSIHTTYDS